METSENNGKTPEWVEVYDYYEVVWLCECGRVWKEYTTYPPDSRTFRRDNCCPTKLSAAVRSRRVDSLPEYAMKKLVTGRASSVKVEGSDCWWEDDWE